MTKTKVAFTTLFTFVFSALGVVAVPVLLLIGANILDYITAMTAAVNQRKRISSNLSMKGIIKKVHMYILILIGAAVDLLLDYTLGVFNMNDFLNMNGIKLDFWVATIVSLWLLFSEMISILENIVAAGTKIPPFLSPLLRKMKGEIESKINIKDKPAIPGDQEMNKKTEAAEQE